MLLEVGKRVNEKKGFLVMESCVMMTFFFGVWRFEVWLCHIDEKSTKKIWDWDRDTP